jgi:hypothetical protein
MTLVSKAWMLDAQEFHRELNTLLAEAVPTHDFRALRDRAASLWRETDPIARTYLEVLRVTPPDVDRSTADPIQPVDLGDWYRLLMASYLTPTRSFRLPDVMKRRLPELGWSPAEARRLAHGRELQSLADTYADAEAIAALAPDLTLAERGWLTQDDVASALDRFRSMDAPTFRRHQDLVVVVEQAYEVHEAAATKPDLVLLMLAD